MAITAKTTNDEIDGVLMPVVKQVLDMLCGAGRHPRQAVQDLRRVVERTSDYVEAELAKEEASAKREADQA